MERRESYTRSGALPRTSFDTGDFALSVHLLAPAEVHGSVLHGAQGVQTLTGTQGHAADGIKINNIICSSPNSVIQFLTSISRI